MILALSLRLAWAVASTVYVMVMCAAIGHPGAYWEFGVRRCPCGRRWPA